MPSTIFWTQIIGKHHTNKFSQENWKNKSVQKGQFLKWRMMIATTFWWECHDQGCRLTVTSYQQGPPFLSQHFRTLIFFIYLPTKTTLSTVTTLFVAQWWSRVDRFLRYMFLQHVWTDLTSLVGVQSLALENKPSLFPLVLSPYFKVATHFCIIIIRLHL